jgi:hypothetical protein
LDNNQRITFVQIFGAKVQRMNEIKKNVSIVEASSGNKIELPRPSNLAELQKITLEAFEIPLNV